MNQKKTSFIEQCWYNVQGLKLWIEVLSPIAPGIVLKPSSSFLQISRFLGISVQECAVCLSLKPVLPHHSECFPFECFVGAVGEADYSTGWHSSI
jgi:hypothetical protein